MMSARVGELTAARAREDGEAIALISEITGLEDSTVMRLLR